MREQLNIAEERLRACLQEQYDFIPVTLTFLPRGLDYHAGVYRVVSEQGTLYLLKVTSRSLYEPRCLVPVYLRNQGIPAVVAPLPTRSNVLWTQLEDWTLFVYPFIDGDTSLTGMTDEQWREVGNIFKRIHQVILPPFGFESIQKETFDPTGYVQWVRAFEAQHLHAEDRRSDSQQALRSFWLAHQPTIHKIITALETLAEELQQQTFSYVICHADLHPANLLRDPLGHVFVIDWDEVMLAPRERDFLFVGKAPADTTLTDDIAPFFQGYGQIEINWFALAYYHYERVIQDVIERTQEVFFRDDLGEETKAECVQSFHQLLAEGGQLDAAHAAEDHAKN